MGSIVADAAALAQLLVDTEANVRATHDPGQAMNNRPCLLVGPPDVDYVNKRNSWNVFALSSQPLGSLSALDELDQLVQHAVERLGVVETAAPRTYQLGPGTDAVPAYVLRVVK